LILALALTVAGLMAGGFSAPASAGGVDRTPYSDSYTYSDDSCGYATTVDVTSSGTLSVRTGTGPATSVYFFTNQSSWREVHTNLATGQSFVIRGHGQGKDVKAKPLGGNLFEVVNKTGGPVFVESSDGDVVYRAAGKFTFRFVIDTHGDLDPASDFVEFLGESVAGHPLTSPCQMAALFWGTGSAARLTAHAIGTTDSPLGYYEYLPPGYGQGPKKPLLIFLHGFGGNGDGTAAQLPNVINDAAIPYYISTDGWPADRPFVVLAPQHNFIDTPAYPYPCDVPFGGSCLMQHQHDYGDPLPAGSACTTPTEVQQFLDYALAHYNVDPARVYVTGLSCGGYGLWESIPRFGAGRIAAAVPISGDGRPALHSSGCSVGSVPIWAFHGDADDVVNPAGSIDTITTLQACPAPPRKELRLTVYPDVGHDAWDHAYSGSQGQDIYTWMLGFTTS